MKTWAQENEDLILFHILKKVPMENIFYVDVGANDPTLLSVTKLFYDKGGRGINIEPSLKYYFRLEKERPEDINLNCAVGNYRGKLVVDEREDGWIFNGNYEYYDLPNNRERVIVNTRTLTDIFCEYLNKTQEIHFLKIDVDGFEKECLEGIDFDKYHPWCICIEISVSKEWENIIINAGYKKLYEDSLNAYYGYGEKIESGDINNIPHRNGIGKYFRWLYQACFGEEYNLYTLNEMFRIKQRGKNLFLPLNYNGHKRVAVYGMSIIGERLCDELVQFGFDVKYGIDRDTEKKYYHINDSIDYINIYRVKEVDYSTIDCIIMTMCVDEKEIEKQIASRTSVYTIRNLILSCIN